MHGLTLVSRLAACLDAVHSGGVRYPLSDEAIVIRKLRFSETSSILWWLTRNHGIVHTLVRRRSKNPGVGGPPDLFYLAEMTWAPGRGSGLAQLREVHVVRVFPGLRQSVGRLAAASYFADALARSIEHGSPVPDLFDLLEKALGYLEGHEASQQVVDRFERRLFASLGLDDGSRPLPVVRGTVFDKPPLTYVMLRRVLGGGGDDPSGCCRDV